MDAGCWLLGAVQILGLVGAVMARATENSSNYALWLGFFISCLIAVAATAMICLWLPCGLGTLSGFTLGAMLIAATGDFGSREGLAARQASRPF
ncbi:MAG: hypothetical protein GTO03_11900 [Planctomycetales bacterium]|nr:hypothetical protein [Planctomycetales bacterium]